ncbi:L-threonylcarbamoyladenylate synthase [Rurimicrobium arvi]|uniref:Threonylcarbamoyl-AMP synthase n=1 Tax=Rurimicrobium arvi TaxID=2049916 RepID=A0ABP8MCU7_9BACT
MYTETGTDIQRAATLLRQGALVAIPTETVYGLAGNGLNPAAVSEIFAVKERPFFNPLILHIPDWQSASLYAAAIPEAAHKLAAALCPGPLTFLLPKKEIVPDLVTAGSPLVALRVPAHPLTRSLLSLLDFPLAAPSANPFGYVSPTSAQHVIDNLGRKIPYILDGGPSSVGVESTIVGFEEPGKIQLYRLGGIAVETLSAISGAEVTDVRSHAVASGPQGPGMLKSHYATHAALYIGNVRELALQFPHQRIASIQFRDTYPGLPGVRQFVLSPSGSLNEAAAQLFAVMRAIDDAGFDVIVAEHFPETGLGPAINDRLNRAQAMHKPGTRLS